MALLSGSPVKSIPFYTFTKMLTLLQVALLSSSIHLVVQKFLGVSACPILHDFITIDIPGPRGCRSTLSMTGLRTSVLGHLPFLPTLFVHSSAPLYNLIQDFTQKTNGIDGDSTTTTVTVLARATYSEGTNSCARPYLMIGYSQGTHRLHLMDKLTQTFPTNLTGDLLCLRQVIGNLVGNTAKFTPSKMLCQRHVALSTRLLALDDQSVMATLGFRIPIAASHLSPPQSVSRS